MPEKSKIKKQPKKRLMPGKEPEQYNNGNNNRYSWDFFDSQLNKYRGKTVSQPGSRMKGLVLAIPRFVINWFKVYEPRWRTTLALILLVAIVSSVFFYGSSFIQAATYTFVQTDWSGGVDAGTAAHPTNQTAWNKYSAQTNIDFSTAGSLKAAASTNNFSETFTATTYKDAVNTTATWDTSGQLSRASAWCNISATACDSSWLNRKAITLNNAASAENLVNFPILVQLSSSNINYAQTQNSGQDLRFVDGDNATSLSFEIEKWDEAGTSLVWVKVPQIDATSTTDYIWMYYNNTSATDGQNVADVWSNSYGAVFHLKETPATANASSVGAISCTPTNMEAADQVAGQVDGGLDFDGVNEFSTCGDNLDFNLTDARTITAWINPDTLPAPDALEAILTKRNNESNFNGWGFWLLGDNAARLLFRYIDTNGATTQAVTSTTPITTTGWYHVAAIYNNESITMYRNGASLSNTNVTTSATVNGGDTAILCIACDDDATDEVPDGQFDEIRFATTNRSADWIEAEYLFSVDNTKYTFTTDIGSSTAQSLTVDADANNIRTATLTKNDTPAGGTITYYLSNDGSTFNQVTPGVEYTFSAAASDLRFRIVLSNDATVQDITISYTGFNSTADLTSNAYNSSSAANLVTKLAWTATGTSATYIVKLQMRSAPDSTGAPGTWSAWCGYDDCSGTNYFETGDNNVTLGSSHPLRSGANDQWFQYKVFIETDGLATPSFDDITISYVVNAPPSFNPDYPTTAAGGVSASQETNSASADYGKVLINYSIRDTDTTTGTTNPGFITPSFEYNIGGGWLSITSGNLAAGDLNNKAVDDVNYTIYTATWDAKTQIPASYSASAQVRVTVNDNEGANNTAQATSANFTLDTTNPTVSAFTMNSSADTLTLTASDDTNLSYRISNNADLSADGVNGTSGQWVAAGGNSINITPSWTFAGSPNEQVYYEVRDTYGNVTSGSAKAPITLTNLDLKDISNEDASNFREFVSWGVYSSVAGATFANYKVYRSTDGSSFSLVSTITDININYYADFGLNSALTYYYKILVTDSDGDISNYSATVSDQPNGQGGTDTTPPTITSVTVAESQATYVRITWTTDELSDSRVDYSISPSTAFGSGQTNSSFVTSHSLTLTNLTPNTAYLFRVKSADIIGNIGTNDNSGAGFSFSTTSGPVISNVTQTAVNDNSATIFWNTDVDSDSHVTYSTNANLSSSTTVGSDTLVGGTNPFQHSVTLTGLVAGTTYYYYVSSEDASLNTSINNNGGSYYSFVTTTDTVAPVISGIQTPVVAPTAGVVIWQTDELATTQLQWGTVTGVYPNTTALDSTLTIFHVVSLTGLAEDTTYFFRAISKDAANNSTTSSESNFTTGSTTVVVGSSSGGGGSNNPAPDTTAPKISNVQTSGITSFTAKISFVTDEDTVGFVQYGKEEGNYTHTAGKADYAKSQSIELRGLAMGTEYHFQVKAVDKGGNVSTSEPGTFTTEFFTESTINIDDVSQFQQEIEEAIESALPSLVPPFIERPQATEVSDNSAVITWRTNIKTFSVVTYADEQDYNPALANPYTVELSDTTNKVTDHRIVLTNLKPNTRYHFRAKSFSLPRLVGQSNDLTFVTKALNIQAQITDIGNSSFRVAWRTADPTSSVVEYRNTKTGVLNQKSIEELATTHEILVDNLTPATTYEVSVFGINSKGNKVQTVSSTRVTTSQDVRAPEILSLKIDTAIIPGRTDRTQTIVSWKTNEPSTSTVYFEEGTTGDETLANKVEINNSFVVDHAVVLSVLKPGGLYRIQVSSTDSAGNTSTLPIKTIVIPRESESILDVIFKNFEESFKFLRQIGR